MLRLEYASFAETNVHLCKQNSRSRSALLICTDLSNTLMCRFDESSCSMTKGCAWSSDMMVCSIEKDLCADIQQSFLCSQHSNKKGKPACAWHTSCESSCSICADCIEDVERETATLINDEKTSTKAKVKLQHRTCVSFMIRRMLKYW